jgi:hypothetical protein
MQFRQGPPFVVSAAFKWMARITARIHRRNADFSGEHLIAQPDKNGSMASGFPVLLRYRALIEGEMAQMKTPKILHALKGINASLVFGMAMLGQNGAHGEVWNTGTTTTPTASTFMYPSSANTNVGIGMTTAPTAKLQVAGNTSISGRLSITSPSDQVQMQSFDQVGMSWRLGTNIGSSGANRNFTIWESQFGNHLTINQATGNVGLGTVAPASLNGRSKVLEISAVGAGSTAHPAIVLRSGAGFSGLQAWEMLLSAADATRTDFQLIAGNTSRLFVSGITGNVGVGTTAPAARMSVANGPVRVDLVPYDTPLGGSFLRVWSGSSALFELSAASNGATAGQAAEFGPNYTISNGNGTDRFARDGAKKAPYIRMDTESGSVSLFGEDGAGTAGAMRNVTQHVGVHVAKDGRVGIGTEAPGAGFQMDVAGKMNIRGDVTVASVTTKVWSVAPDYVFEKGYQLASLEHVEKFVDKHKHLPEIPSAREIKDKGLDLAEMNLKLLKKVEELTLYAITQDKKAVSQDRKIAELSASVEKLIKQRKD